MFTKIYENIKKFILNNYKFIIMYIVILFLLLFKLPFSIYKTGSSINLDKRVFVEEGFETGDIEMAYVSVIKGTIPAYLLSYAFQNWDLVKNSDVVYNNQTIEETEKIERLEMEEAVSNATLVAFTKAEKEITISEKTNTIIYNDGINKDIKLFDEILEVDGLLVEDVSTIKNYIQTKNVDDEVVLKIKRDNKEKEVKALVYIKDNTKMLGLSILTTYKYTTNPEVKLKTKASEMGPSGGLMMSLAIYNSITKEDITKGKKIIGTGTIDKDGNVGEIGGVKYKILGAEKNKGDIFFCPKENYEEANKIKNENNLKIEIVAVSTFDEAINYLNNYK